MTHPISRYCKGETCRCGQPATHKVEENIFDDDPFPMRHPFTAYVCCECFGKIMGPAAEHNADDLKKGLLLR